MNENYEPEQVGKRIRHALFRLNKKANAFAKELGVSKMTVSHWMAGTRSIRDPGMKLKVAQKLGMTVAELDYGSQETIKTNLLEVAIRSVAMAEERAGVQLDSEHRAKAIKSAYNLVNCGVSDPTEFISQAISGELAHR